jgi:hypothetical protein
MWWRCGGRVVPGIHATLIKRLIKTDIATNAEPGIGAQKYDASEAIGWE